MPYLTFSTEVQDETDKPDTKDQPEGALERLKKAKGRYKELIRQYRGEVVHGSPTLDEAYYHFASDPQSDANRRNRNETQVVTKSLRSAEKRGDKHLSYWKLLRVNQLWIWVIDDGIYIRSLLYNLLNQC